MCDELWRFDEISRTDATRVARLNAAQSSDELCIAVVRALATAPLMGNLRIGKESAENNDVHHRIVIQFHVGADLFDLFFNSCTGYRAQFRRSAEIGLRFNEFLIAQLKGTIDREWRNELSGRLLDHLFNDRGPVQIEKAFVLRSLDTRLAKMWMCTRRMTVEGSVADLPLGLTNEKLLLPNNVQWAVLSRNDQDAWLEVKGAFVGEQLYQPKDPFFRASRLHLSGEA